jgi:hypothetical protein
MTLLFVQNGIVKNKMAAKSSKTGQFTNGYSHLITGSHFVW